MAGDGATCFGLNESVSPLGGDLNNNKKENVKIQILIKQSHTYTHKKKEDEVLQELWLKRA